MKTMKTKSELLKAFFKLKNSCNSCNNCDSCYNCYNCNSCNSCNNCNNCYNCYGCIFCDSCILCYNLKNRVDGYWLLNELVTKKEFQAAIKELQI